MPELPEVETVARGLRHHLAGDVIESCLVLRQESIAHPSKSAFVRLLKGYEILDVGRRGKYVLIALTDDATLVVHLRMSGRLLIKDTVGEVDKFTRVVIQLRSGRQLHFEDMRVFGRLWFVKPGESLHAIVAGIASLGVEPLSDLTDDYLVAAFKNKKQPVKSALLDQHIIAGVGNIYADESLHLAGINPCRPAGSLTRPELNELTATISSVLQTAIERGGSSLKDYQNAMGENGSYQQEAWVYARAKQPCRSCATPIERVKLSGRSTHFCPNCQPRSRRCQTRT
ncbi:MAG: bifunctional DNA-formamidopyrimidine glycosylase/DNA-(apurinic or apyrimidinic site) lyase [Candidatus Obscuribacterales bacterium]|nr:bifunctional DNA-formamidopyrimidine glycosylase/DNA-(apurinic or apyrimidinic site) lyase [Candidatus Obscuribacterales bacterium]